ncbi:MAG: hydroxyethylthiazole kinase [Deltaproteobacteria bacterium]|nr:hydroxyethylthiazole kinase [Deltaproteobacteria bacterium]
MKISASQVWSAIVEIRSRAPVVHNITNYVVMNSTANALLSLGASPVMAHAVDEVEDMVTIASALVINIGTLSPPWVEAMDAAARKARKRGIPIVLDPVGAGATPYRTRTARDLIENVSPSILRGNASEILALLESKAKTKGVDSTARSDSALEVAQRLSEIYECIVCVSGETDYIIDGADITRVMNGHPMMPRVTGLGCTATALCGAFAAVSESPALAAAEAMAVMGIAGEMAADVAQGPGSLQVRFLDALYRMSEEDVRRRLRTEG